MATEISIIDGDLTTGKVTLDPSGTVEVEKGKRVIWEIAETASNIVSFSITKKNVPNSEDIFMDLDQPPKKQTKKGGARVKFLAQDYAQYIYSINWIDNDGHEHKDDPIISVKPTPSHDSWLLAPLPKLVAGIVIGLAAIVTITFILKKKRKK